MATVVAPQIFGVIIYSNGLYLFMIISHEKGVSWDLFYKTKNLTCPHSQNYTGHDHYMNC